MFFQLRSVLQDTNVGKESLQKKNRFPIGSGFLIKEVYLCGKTITEYKQPTLLSVPQIPISFSAKLGSL